MGSSDSKSDMANHDKWEKEKPCCVNRTEQYITENNLGQLSFDK